jgi:hypothetical protein
MTRYWFKPKRYGYGATPVTWEGWAVTAAFVLFVIGASYWRLMHSLPTGEDWYYWLAAVLAAAAVLVAVSYWKTDGEWRWQWGRDTDTNTGK